MLLGYTRVSTDAQDVEFQRAILRTAGCERLYEEVASSVGRNRPKLVHLLDHHQSDVVMVTRLDRLAHSVRDLLKVAKQIGHAKAGLRSLAEPWVDTTSPTGRVVLTAFAGLADFERTLLFTRTRAGRFAAKQRGVRLGRLPKVGSGQLALARKLVDEGRPVREVAEVLKCHRATLHRALFRTSPTAAAWESQDDTAPSSCRCHRVDVAGFYGGCDEAIAASQPNQIKPAAQQGDEDRDSIRSHVGDACCA